jgi:mRNA interferase RelE/StbE
MSMSYTVCLRPGAERQRQKLSGEMRSRISQILLSLEQNPRPPGVFKLSGRENQWRLRVGDYRIVYEIDDTAELVTVLRIAHRRQVYR